MKLPEHLTIRFSFVGGATFISGVSGYVTTSNLAEIEDEVVSEPGDLFAKGEGEYFFRAHWEPGQYGFEGRCEIEPYWELDLLEFAALAAEKE